jgi:hypothetical protein
MVLCEIDLDLPMRTSMHSTYDLDIHVLLEFLL